MLYLFVVAVFFTFLLYFLVAFYAFFLLFHWCFKIWDTISFLHSVTSRLKKFLFIHGWIVFNLRMLVRNIFKNHFVLLRFLQILNKNVWKCCLWFWNLGMLNISISDKSFVYGLSFAQYLQRKVGFEGELERSANIVRGAEKGPITSHHCNRKTHSYNLSRAPLIPYGYQTTLPRGEWWVAAQLH